MTPLLRNSWWLLAIVPFAFLLYTVVQLNVPVPFLDEWELVPLLEKMYGGSLTLDDLWKLHNEHRLLFPKMIMLGLARLTDWDIRYEMATSVLLAVGIFLLLALQVKITARKLAAPELRWAIPLFSIIIFSISQYQNWFWGWQLQMFLSGFGVIGGIVLLANPPVTWFRFVGAALLGIVASYSFGNGGVFWLVGLFVLLVVTEPGKGRWFRLAVWLLLSGLTMGLYFYHYDRLGEHPPLVLLFSEPIQYFIYVFKYFGNICAQYPSSPTSINGGFSLIYGIGGLGILIWALGVLRRNKLIEFKTLVPFLAMSLYTIGSALVIGVGRVGLGTDQAVASRYCTVTAPFWASLVMVLLILLIKTKAQLMSSLAVQRRTAEWVLQLVTILLIVGSALAFNRAENMVRAQDVGRKRLLTIPIHPGAGVDYSSLRAIHPQPRLILERFPFLKEHRLSIFRDESTGTPPAP
jgi:hypothetical protein